MGDATINQAQAQPDEKENISFSQGYIILHVHCMLALVLALLLALPQFTRTCLLFTLDENT